MCCWEITNLSDSGIATVDVAFTVWSDDVYYWHDVIWCGTAANNTVYVKWEIPLSSVGDSPVRERSPWLMRKKNCPGLKYVGHSIKFFSDVAKYWLLSSVVKVENLRWGNSVFSVGPQPWGHVGPIRCWCEWIFYSIFCEPATSNCRQLFCTVVVTCCLQCFDAVGWAAGRASGL